MPAPTLPTGVNEAAGRLFSDFLIESVKRRARVPVSQATLDTWEILSIADEQIRSAVVPLMISVGEDYLTASADFTISSGTTTYRPPARGMKIREVQFVNADGNRIDIPRVDIEELPHRSDGFYILGNGVVLINPSRWDGYTLRVTYYLRPSRLVVGADAGVSQSVNRGTGVITLYAASANLTGATTCDLVRGTAPFEVLALDVACTVAGAAVTITTPADIPAAWGAAGDLVTLPQQSPAPQIHPDLFAYLAQLVTVQILDGNGDQPAFERAGVLLKRLETDAIHLLTPRVEGEIIPVGGYSPLWDRGWSFQR